MGAGFFTFQPVSTFWVACAGALALGRPLPAAACFALYGAGRAVMVVWPRRRTDDPTAAVERLTRRRGALLRANAVALVVCGILLAVAPAAGGATLVQDGAYDPSSSGTSIAFATRAGDVVVRPGGREPRRSLRRRLPAVSGRPAARRPRPAGISVVDWTTGDELARVDNPNASRPALDWPLVAFGLPGRGFKRLVVRNLQTGGSRVHASVRAYLQLGRPSLSGGRLAWHVASRKQLDDRAEGPLLGRVKRVVARSRIGLLQNPTVRASRIAWVDGRSGASYLRLRRVWGGSRTTVASMRTRARAYWTTSLAPGAVYWTRWTLASGASSVYRTGF